MFGTVQQCFDLGAARVGATGRRRLRAECQNDDQLGGALAHTADVSVQDVPYSRRILSSLLLIRPTRRRVP